MFMLFAIFTLFLLTRKRIGLLNVITNGLGVEAISLYFIPPSLLASLAFLGSFSLFPFFLGVVLCPLLVLLLALGSVGGSLLYKKRKEGELLDEEVSLDSLKKSLSSTMSRVETLSLLARPVTLGVRLLVNLTVGHLILGVVNSSSLIGITSGFVLYYEGVVILIQSVVFSMLVYFYYKSGLER